jgi:integrase
VSWKGKNRLAFFVTLADLPLIRKSLLTGYHILNKGHQPPVKERRNPAVSNSIEIMAILFHFAADSVYIKVTRILVFSY